MVILPLQQHARPVPRWRATPRTPSPPKHCWQAPQATTCLCWTPPATKLLHCSLDTQHGVHVNYMCCCVFLLPEPSPWSPRVHAVAFCPFLLPPPPEQPLEDAAKESQAGTDAGMSVIDRALTTDNNAAPSDMQTGISPATNLAEAASDEPQAPIADRVVLVSVGADRCLCVWRVRPTPSRLRQFRLKSGQTVNALCHARYANLHPLFFPYHQHVDGCRQTNPPTCQQQHAPILSCFIAPINAHSHQAVALYGDGKGGIGTWHHQVRNSRPSMLQTNVGAAIHCMASCPHPAAPSLVRVLVLPSSTPFPPTPFPNSFSKLIFKFKHKAWHAVQCSSVPNKWTVMFVGWRFIFSAVQTVAQSAQRAHTH